MTPSDDIFAKKITTYLDRGTADLKPGIAYRLQLARAEALARLGDPVRSAEFSVAVANAGGGGTAGGGRGFWASGCRPAARMPCRPPGSLRPGRKRERALFVVACALQPILESPVQVCIDRQLRGQDRCVRFLDVVQLLIGLPLLKAETGGHDQ